MNQFITTSDAARILGCSPDSVRRYERQGGLRAAAKVGKGRRLERLFLEKDVRLFKLARTLAGTVRRRADFNRGR